MTPTLHRYTGRCPPRGRILPWGGPAAKPGPPRCAAARVATPRGAHFALGRPGGKNCAPTLRRCAGRCPPEGVLFALGRPGGNTGAPTLRRSAGWRDILRT